MLCVIESLVDLFVELLVISIVREWPEATVSIINLIGAAFDLT